MKLILKIVAYIGLVLTILPSFLVFQGVITLQTNNYLMFLGTLIWFLAAPFWMNKNPEPEPQE